MNRNPRGQSESRPPVSLRARIFSLLTVAGATTPEALMALTQCKAHIQDRLTVETTLRECGLRPAKFTADDTLELFYNLRKGRQDMGYISKGWEEPGFRVGNDVEVPVRRLADLKDHAFEVLEYCATRGVAVTLHSSDDALRVVFETVIYSDGFNDKVLAQVFHYLGECTDKATELFLG